ncbi:hypothetical protein V8C37DRAFT_377605 [Trichoderma ceciliae]
MALLAVLSVAVGCCQCCQCCQTTNDLGCSSTKQAGQGARYDADGDAAAAGGGGGCRSPSIRAGLQVFVNEPLPALAEEMLG